MIYNYCTLFDSHYITRGLAMYESLVKFSDNFHLYIVAFDQDCFEQLSTLDLRYVSVISLESFEDSKLLAVKPTRTIAEYCWTCTPSVIKYCIEKYTLPSCTYLDADLLFYSNPEILIQEKQQKSVLITPHRYTTQYDQSSTSGKYCVQFMTFDNTADGIEVLNTWREACIEWCYAKFEDGKFGDQKYLDSWTTDYNSVHELAHLGGGVAPWNIQQYDFSAVEGSVSGVEKSTSQSFDLVFYHFHNLKFSVNGSVDLSTYLLEKNDINLIYINYIKQLILIDLKLTQRFGVGNYHGITKASFDWKSPIRMIKRKFKGNYNIVNINQAHKK